MASSKTISKEQRAALAGLIDAFLPEELRPARRSRHRTLRRLGGIAALALLGALLYAAARRAGE